MPLDETKIAPCFFSGLGGAGGAIVDELSRKLKKYDSFERYQDLLHFIAFDTDADDLGRLVWGDAHSSGIYTFRFLRTLGEVSSRSIAELKTIAISR